MSRFYKVTKRIYSNDLKVTEHPDGNWVKREEYEQLKQRCAELELLIKDCDEYLDINKCSSIGYLSVLHKCMKQLRKEQEK